MSWMRPPSPLRLPGEGGSAAPPLRPVQAHSLETCFQELPSSVLKPELPFFSRYESCGCEVACVSGIQLNLSGDHLFYSPARVNLKLFSKKRSLCWSFSLLFQKYIAGLLRDLMPSQCTGQVLRKAKAIPSFKGNSSLFFQLLWTQSYLLIIFRQEKAAA